jgi:MFS family permease
MVGTAFWGFALAMVPIGPIMDMIGMSRVIYFALILENKNKKQL